jgi:hypothetical protein
MGCLRSAADPFNAFGLKYDNEKRRNKKQEQQEAADAYEREKFGEDLESWLGNYMNVISDPEINEQLLGAEEKYRPMWTDLGLADYERTLFGSDEQAGQLDILSRMVPEFSEIYADASTRQREADIEDIEALGGRATEALRASDPEMQKLLSQQGDLTDMLAQRAQGVTPQQQRMAEQQAREGGMARGRGYGEGTLAGEILGREEFQRQNRAEYGMAAGQRFGMLKGTSADPFQAILGRPSGAATAGQNQQQLGMYGQQQYMGPAIFDPNMGINLGLGQQANQMNYNAAVMGAESQEKAGMFAAGGAVGAAGLTALI